MTLWKHSDFMKLWAGQTISEIGSRITREGLPMGAVLMMGVTPLTMSGLSLATQLPAAFLGLFIGVIVDRLSRRRTMMLTDVLRALLLLLIPVAAMTGILRLWMFFVVAALSGIFALVFDVAYQAYLPSLIERSNLIEGNSKFGVTSSAAEIIGPGLTGLLVQALTAPKAIALDALSYFISAASIWSIRTKEAGTPCCQPHESPLDARNWRRELVDGIAILKENRILLTLAGVAATSGFASRAIFVLDTLYALRNLHLSAFMFGITITMGGVGALVGAALSNRLVTRFGVGKTMIVTLLLQGLSATCWMFAGGPVWKTMLFILSWQFFGDAFGTVYEILDVTLRQTVISDALLGRVNATIRSAEFGLMAIGTLVSGILAQVIGIRDTMAFAAVGMMLTTLWVVFSPIRKLQRMPDTALFAHTPTRD